MMADLEQQQPNPRSGCPHHCCPRWALVLQAVVTTVALPCCSADGRPIPGQPPLITDMCLQLEPGSRCLLIGANGAGKTTLLKVLAGKHMVPRDQVTALGAPPFHATELTTSGQLAYVGGNWTRDIAFAGTSVPLTVGSWALATRIPVAIAVAS
eukprot:GHUV01048103.1.p1 GENE.GHUV01048103.1~~GHUV01048103.1.p1  ORF type:complete len:154 (-),score=42.86 GHUV01048103.1:49-510(-)